MNIYPKLELVKGAEMEYICFRNTDERLESDGTLSIYPKHIATDHPMHHFSDFQEEDVKNEIEAAGFRFERRFCGMISHDEYLNEGCILNFRKGAQ